MKISIKEIEYFNDNIIVTGVTDLGIIKGIWRNDALPEIDQTYYFELDIDSIDKGDVSVIHNDVIYGVKVSGESCVFIGKCENIDDVYVIRFSGDWIEMVEIQNEDLDIKKGDNICFKQKIENISIYPYTV